MSIIKFFAPYKKFAIGLLIVSAIIVTWIYSLLKPQRILPIYEPNQVNIELVDSTVQEIRKYHRIADWKLVNQNGANISEKNYADKIYIADFFFTTCQTICPKMTQHMGYLQSKLKDQQDVLLLSHTVTPEIDTVAQLKRYAQKKGVIDSKWNLVTGDKKDIYDLARKSYMVAKVQPYSKYDLIHTENFVLIDQKRRIRGYYDGTSLEEVQQLLEDIQLLLN